MTSSKSGATGIHISGKPLKNTVRQYHSYIKYLTVPRHQHDNAVFGDDRLKSLRSLEDPMRRVIFDAMQASRRPLRFDDLEDAQANVVMRQTAIETMTRLNTGVYDADYFDPTVLLYPRIGGTFYNSSKRLWFNSLSWSQMDFADPWSPAFEQRKGSTGANDLYQMFPFRGECAGALQMCVFRGALEALGAAKFNATQNGPLEIGPWGASVRVFMQKVPLTEEPIPGDYLYFRNKPDYLKWDPDGFWQGLNCLYVGKDALGTRRYSGLGAVWQSETELRTALQNAYVGGCYPHRVDDPAKEIIFTVHARLVLQTTQALERIEEKEVKAVARASAGRAGVRPTARVLRRAGFDEQENGVFVHDGICLKDLSEALGFDLTMLRQTVSAPFDNPSYRIQLEGVPCTVEYLNADAGRRDGESMVRAIVNLSDARGVKRRKRR